MSLFRYTRLVVTASPLYMCRYMLCNYQHIEARGAARDWILIRVRDEMTSLAPTHGADLIAAICGRLW